MPGVKEKENIENINTKNIKTEKENEDENEEEIEIVINDKKTDNKNISEQEKENNEIIDNKENQIKIEENIYITEKENEKIQEKEKEDIINNNIQTTKINNLNNEKKENQIEENNKMICPKPKDRISLSQIKKHSWLQKIVEFYGGYPETKEIMEKIDLIKITEKKKVKVIAFLKLMFCGH